MFSFLRKNHAKGVRHDAENWLRLGEKIYHYRRDLLSDNDVQELVQATVDVRENLKKKAEPARIKMAADRLEEVISRVGGGYYPKSAIAENIEVLLVAAILAIGIRTYFVQPFKIPTNSMMPTYYGMTPEVYMEADEEPGVVRSAARTLFLGAGRVGVEARQAGVCYLVYRSGQGQSGLFDVVPDRKWLFFPTRKREFTVVINDEPHHFRVPFEFHAVEDVLRDVFFPDHASLGEAINEKEREGAYRRGPDNVILIETDREVEAGDPVISFDILTGDQLFVDRMSYHFIRPKPGDSFVFRTGMIEALNDDSYYIKRLVGKGEDELEVREPYLYRNGQPIDERRVFRRIHEKEGLYGGYVADGNLSAGNTFRIPPGEFFAMGDNSGNSLDSRSFGSVPARALVGRPILIYYPFTTRWGLPE